MSGATLTATARRLLRKFGELSAITFVSGEVRNAATGAVTTPGTVQQIDGYGYPADYMEKDVDGVVIKAGDTRFILEKVSQRPQVGWTATFDSVAYRVMDVKKIRYAGDDVAYICQLRKS